jgi:hypothetical protein
MDPLKLIALGLDADHVERDASTLVRGAHLRWQLDPILNYPDGGFEIWRRAYLPLASQPKTCWSVTTPLPAELAVGNAEPFPLGRLASSSPEGLLIEDGRDLDLIFETRSMWRADVRYSVAEGGYIDANARACSGAVLDRERRDYPVTGGIAGWACERLRHLEPPCADCCECLTVGRKSSTAAKDECNCHCSCGDDKARPPKHRERERALREEERKQRAAKDRFRKPARPLPSHLRSGVAARDTQTPGYTVAAQSTAPAASSAQSAKERRIERPPMRARSSLVARSSNTTESASAEQRATLAALLRILLCWIWLAWRGFIYSVLCYLCTSRRDTTIHKGVLVLEGRDIRELEIYGDKLCIHEICYYARATAAKEKWQRIGTVNWPVSEAEISARLTIENLPTYLADEWSDPAVATSLISTLAELRAATSMWDHERTDSEAAGGPSLTWYSWQMLQIAAIAPYFARLLGLAYIDRTAASGEHYDYKVVSVDDATVATEYDNLRLEAYRSLVAVQGVAASEIEIPGFGKTGRVQLTWDPADALTLETDLPLGYHVYAGDYGFTHPATDPAWSDLIWLTSASPALSSAEQPPSFADPATYEGWGAWQVAALDLFGRYGNIDATHWANLASISTPAAPASITATVLLEGDPYLTAAQTAEALPLPGALELTWQWDDVAYNARSHETLEFYPLLHQGGFSTLAVQALSLSDEGDRAEVTTNASLGAETRGAWAWLEVDGERWRVDVTSGDKVWILPRIEEPLPGDDEPQRIYPTLASPHAVELIPDPQYAGWWSRQLTAQRVSQQPFRSGTLTQVGSNGTARSIETSFASALYSSDVHLGMIVITTASASLRYRIAGREADSGSLLSFRIQPADAAAQAYAFSAGEACAWYPGYRLVFALTDTDLPFAISDVTTNGMASCKCSIVAENTSSVVAGTRQGPAGNPATGLWRKFERPDAPTVTTIPLTYASRPDYFGKSEFTLNWTARTDESYLVYRATDTGLLDAELVLRFRDELPNARTNGSLEAVVLASWLADSARDGTAGIDELRTQANAFAAGADPSGDLAEWLVAQARKTTAAVSIHSSLATIWSSVYGKQETELAAADRTTYLMNLAARDDLLSAWSQINAQPVSGGSYTDSFPGRASNWYFYRVRSIDRAQNRSVTLSPPIGPVALLDTTPPKAPTLIWVGESGTIRFEWRDTVTNIVRYRIYRTQDKERAVDPRLMGDPIVDTDGYARTAADQVPQGSIWYYQIVSTHKVEYEKDSATRELLIDSQDYVYVEASTYSRTPPPPPVWKSQTLIQNGIQLTVEFGDEHVEFMLQRRSAAGRVWGTLISWTAVTGTEAVFQDQDLPARGQYLYRVQVKNAAGIQNVTDNVYLYEHE